MWKMTENKVRQYFVVYCYSKDCYNGASAEHDNMKFIHCAKASDNWNCGVHLYEPIKATKRQNTRQVCMQLKDSRHNKATEHLRWLPCLKALQKYWTKTFVTAHVLKTEQNRNLLTCFWRFVLHVSATAKLREGFVEKSLRVEVLRLMPQRLSVL